MEHEKRVGKYVTIYWNRGLKKKPQINWSAIGSVSVAETKRFIKRLNRAVGLIEKSNKHYIK